MTISLRPLRTRLPRRLGSCSRFRPSWRATSHAMRCTTPRSIRRLLQGGLPFSLHSEEWHRLCCSHLHKKVPIWTVRTHDRPFPRFHVAPRSMQLGLSSTLACSGHWHFLALPNSVIVFGLLRWPPLARGHLACNYTTSYRSLASVRCGIFRPRDPAHQVPGQGFEPQSTDPKSVVLPLDDPGARVRP